MMKRKKTFVYPDPKLLVMAIILAIILNACQPVMAPEPTQPGPPTDKPTATMTQALPENTPTNSPEHTHEPTPEPSPTPTPVKFQGQQSINAQNINQITLLTKIGEAYVRHLAWQNGGSRLAVCTSLGLDIFSINPFEKVQQLNNNIACESIAWSKDGLLLALALPSSKIQIFDAETWQEKISLETGLEAISDLAWSPDSKQLAVGAMNGSAFVYTTPIETGTQTMSKLFPHTYGKVLLAWSPDGKQLVTGSSDGRLISWDAKNGSMIALLQGHHAAIDAVTWSPKNDKLASTSEDGTLIVWNIENGTPEQTITGSSPIAWSQDGKSLFFNQDNQLVKVLLKDNAEAKPFGSKPIQPLRIAVAPNDSNLAVINHLGTLLIINEQDAKQSSSYEQYGLSVTSLVTSPDGKQLARLNANGGFSLLNTQNGKQAAQFEGISVFANQILWSPDGELIALPGQFNTVRIFETASKTFLKDLEMQSPGSASSLAWSPDSQTLAAGQSNGELTNWSRENNWRRIGPMETHADNVNALAWSPDGKTLVLGDEQGVIRVWDPWQKANLNRIEGHGAGVLDIAFSPKENLLATAGAEGHIFIRDKESYSIQATLDASPCHINRVKWSPDGTLLASVDSCGALRVWNTESSALIETFQSSNQALYGLDWSSDGKTILTAGLDGVLNIWGIP